MSKVMIIDDEPFILMMLDDKFRREGFEVVSTRVSVGAYELARDERPDLIIVDWMMPEISGLEVCRQVKSDPDLSHIPIFILTARGRSEDEEKGLKCGAEKFITKPFSPQQLLSLVKQEIGRNR